MPGARPRATEDAPAASQAREGSRFPLLLVVVAVLLSGFTAFGLLAPGFLFVAFAPEADQVLNTTATLIGAGVAILAWIRFVETGQLDSLLQSSAFTVLFAGNSLALILMVGGQAAFGFEHSEPGQAPLYVWTAQRLLAAPLLLMAAISAMAVGSWTFRRTRTLSTLIVLGPTALLLVLAAIILAARGTLPALIPSSTLALLAGPLDRVSADLLSPPMLTLQLAIAALYVAAGLGYGLAYQRSQPGRPYHAYLSAGLMVAAFGQVHFSVVPGAYGGLVTSGDVLRTLFYAIVGIGVAAATRQDLRELRQAHFSLRRLHAAESERIVVEERARLARDMHDGLVQNLWLARLTHGQLAQSLAHTPDSPPEAHQAAERVDALLADALAEARQAVVTLQPQADASFGSLLRRYVEDHADRFGLEVECTVEGTPIALPAHTAADALRICREAINNVRKHADATSLHVRLESSRELVRLTIADNGRGFESDKSQHRGFGLRSMHERAAGIGGLLHVESEPMSGTRVILELPAGSSSLPEQ